MSMIEMLYPPKVADNVLSLLSTYRIDGYDCAVHTLGVCVLDFDKYALYLLPPARVPAQVDEEWSALEKLRYISWLLDLYHRAVNRLIRIVYVDVWNLSPDAGPRTALADQIDISAKNMKTRIRAMHDRLGVPDKMAYEFQMVVNDKSRTISSFLRYHYCDICEIEKIGGGHKNTITFAPHLNHRLYLAKSGTTTYKANKDHCRDSFIWWCEKFDVDIRHIDKSVRKDAADAFMQLIAILCGRNGATVKKQKLKPATAINGSTR